MQSDEDRMYALSVWFPIRVERNKKVFQSLSDEFYMKERIIILDDISSIWKNEEKESEEFSTFKMMTTEWLYEESKSSLF